MVQECRWIFSAKQILYVVQGYGFVPARSVEDMLNLGVIGSGRVCEVGYEEEVCVQIVVVKGAYRLMCRFVLTYEDDIGSTRVDEKLCIMS